MFNSSKLLLNLLLISAIDSTNKEKESKKIEWTDIFTTIAVCIFLFLLFVVIAKKQEYEVAEIMKKHPEFTKLEASVYANNLRVNDVVLESKNGPVVKTASQRTGTSSIFGPSQSPFTTTNSYHSKTYVPTQSKSYVSTNPKVFRTATYASRNLGQIPTPSKSYVPTNPGPFHSATLHQPTPRYFPPRVSISEEKAAEFLAKYSEAVSVKERIIQFKGLNLLTKKAVLVKLMKTLKNLSFMTSCYEDCLFETYISNLSKIKDISDYLSLEIVNPEISDTLVEYFNFLIDPNIFN
jgi:hypothetical protein